MNRQLDQLTESFTIALADRVRRMKAEGIPVIGLQTGDPDFNTPQPIMNAAYEAMQAGATHYSNSRGLPALREAIAERMQREHSVAYNPVNEILVTHGAIHAYHVALQAILNVEDAVLVPDPSWQTHANMVKLLRGEAIRVAGTPENNFFPTMDAWQEALTENTKALVINTPCNPTGMVASRDYLQQVVDFAVENDLYILSDEVYDKLLYDVDHVSAASIAGARERILLINSFSKSYAMTGWRIGYLCAPSHLINNALKVSQHTITNVAEFSQRAAILAMRDEDVAKTVDMMIAAYTRRRQLVLDIAAQHADNPVGIIKPQGAFYFFLDVRGLGMSSNAIAEAIINEVQVAVVPGSAYGAQGEGFLRMTTAASDSEIEVGFTKILAWANGQR